MRTRIILISALTVAFVAVVLVATSSDKEASGGSGDSGSSAKRVAASFYPLAFVAQELGGDGVEVENLTPPGAEPHDLELSAGSVEALQSADVVLLMGRDFQPQLEEAADRASGRVIEVLDAPILGLVRDDDPHIWLDPPRLSFIAKRVASALHQREALTPLIERIIELDREYRAGLADCERREIVTSHDAFGYLADRYDLRQIPITGLSPEAEPSPAELADSIEEVRRSGATTVFSESLVSPRLAETVARETGAQTEVLNTLEGLEPEEEARGEDYFTLMRENLELLREALGCR